ncbi:MAG: helix-turn-helix transcriptional regulator [Bryobacteraceae bacterium]|jgi:DNA-binding CsgD family transcriptional regulator
MRVAETALDLIGLIYEAVEDSEGWPVFLARLMKAMNGTAAALHFQDLGSGAENISVNMGLDPALAKAYAEHYHHVNILLQRAAPLLTPGTIVTNPQICEDATLARSEYYDEFMRPQDIFYVAGGAIARKGTQTSLTSIFRPRRGGPYLEPEIALVKLLIPHLRRAARLRHGLNMLQVETTALDALTLGILIVDEHLEVLCANSSGRKILAEKDGMAMAGNRLALRRPQDATELRRLSLRACEPLVGPAIRTGGVMTITRPSGRRPYSVVVSPTEARVLGWNDGKPAAILFINDPDNQAMPNDALLARLYGLTPAESSLTRILLRGEDLNDACDEMSIRRTTARTHLRHIFEKVGVSRQAELLAVLLRTAGSVKTSAR